MDFSIKLSNGQFLQGMIKSPGEHAKAVVIMVHGLGEHILRYENWADKFLQQDIAFTGVDLPGHGRSDGRKGNIKSYILLDEMITVLLDSCRKTFNGLPLFIYGHSLGGTIVLNHLVRVRPKIKGAIVTSPWLRLSFEPPKSKVALASLMKNFVPGLVQPSGLNPAHLSHNHEVVEKYVSDPLVHDKISVSLFDGTMKAASYTLEHAGDLKVPTLLIHGSEDMITSPQGSREFAAGSDKVDLKIWDGGYHELHNEQFGNDVFETIISWINKHLD
jgi:acylglycerol lipase